jgi:hypothetical protein
MRSVITWRLWAASKGRHLPANSHHKHTSNARKSQGKKGNNQHFLVGYVGLRKNKTQKATKTKKKEALHLTAFYAIL